MTKEGEGNEYDRDKIISEETEMARMWVLPRSITTRILLQYIPAYSVA